MVQQPTPNRRRTAAIVIQWICLFAALAIFITGICSIIVGNNIIAGVITFVVAFATLPFGIKIDLSPLLRSKKIGILVICGIILIGSLSYNIYNALPLFHRWTGNPQATPTSPLNKEPTHSPVPVSALEATDQSGLIPRDRQPTVNDPLGNNRQGYGWDQGPNSQKTGACDFVSGIYYQISAPAGSSGVGCNMEQTKGIFSNFVYQIQMTILEGVDNDNASVCTAFRVNDKTLTQDSVCFTQDGYWSVSGSSGMLSSDPNPFPYFVTGIKQINYITVQARGSTFQVQVNGHDLGGTYTDPGISSGFLGINLSPGTSESKVAFSNLRVWTL